MPIPQSSSAQCEIGKKHHPPQANMLRNENFLPDPKIGDQPKLTLYTTAGGWAEIRASNDAPALLRLAWKPALHQWAKAFPGNRHCHYLNGMHN